MHDANGATTTARPQSGTQNGDSWMTNTEQTSPPRPVTQSSQPNTPEQLSKEFLKQTYPDADDITVSRVIPNCLGGTLCILDYKWFD